MHSIATRQYLIRKPVVQARVVAAKCRRPLNFDAETYARRDAVGRYVRRPKQWRLVATKYEKRAANYRATVVIAAFVIRLTSRAARQALPGKCRVQVVEEEPFDELAPAAHPDLLKDAAQVVVYGVLGDEERLGDARRKEAAHDEFHDLLLARAQAVGGHAKGQQLLGLRGFYYDHRLRAPLRGRLGQGPVER